MYPCERAFNLTDATAAVPPSYDSACQLRRKNPTCQDEANADWRVGLSGRGGTKYFFARFQKSTCAFIGDLRRCYSLSHKLDSIPTWLTRSTMVPSASILVRSVLKEREPRPSLTTLKAPPTLALQTMRAAMSKSVCAIYFSRSEMVF